MTDWDEAGTPGMDDRALVAAHVAGDPDAFTELVRRHRDRMWAVALRTAGDPEEAADALQDALISAYRNAASYRGEAAVTTWLHRVVVNACLDRMRRRKARPSVPLMDDDPDSGARAVPDPRDDMDRLELRMEIDKALRALPVDQRSAIVLVDVEGLSVAEAATLLGVPEGTVKSRCSRGRARLAVALAGLRNPDVGITDDGNRSAAGGVPPSPAPSPGSVPSQHEGSTLPGTDPPVGASEAPRPSPEVSP
jgi:RNA polymerase sigma-70 factor (ECF subfamily)